METIKADEIVRMYLSFFSLYRIVLQAKKLDKSTFFNFYQPVIDVGRTYSRVCSLKELFRRYVPWHQYIPLIKGSLGSQLGWKTVSTKTQSMEILGNFNQELGTRFKGGYNSSVFLFVCLHFPNLVYQL